MLCGVHPAVALTLLGGVTEPGQENQPSSRPDAIVEVVEGYFEYESLPRLSRVPDIRRVQDLAGTRVPVRNGGPEDIEEHFIVEIEYIRRGTEVLLSRYQAIRPDDSLFQYYLAEEPGDEPVLSLAEAMRGTLLFVTVSELPPGKSVWDYVDAADTRIDPAPLSLQGGTGEGVLAWLDREKVLQARILEYAALTDDRGVVGIKRLVVQSVHAGVDLRVEFGPGAAVGGNRACIQTIVGRCAPLLFLGCPGPEVCEERPYPACDCTLLDPDICIPIGVVGPCETWECADSEDPCKAVVHGTVKPSGAIVISVCCRC